MRQATLLAALAVVLLTGCGGDSEPATARPAEGSFVGEVEGSDAFVAIVAGKANVVAYVCDGANGVAVLFTGKRSGDAVSLTADDGSTFKARLERAEAHGSVELVDSDDELTFSAVRADGAAGFYRARATVDGQPVTAGWIVLRDGRQRGAVRTATVTAAPPLDTTTRTAMLAGAGTISPVLITPTIVSRAGFNFGGGFG